ncbi:MAG: TRAP transporter substrate-binding protein DctP [Mesorhizobium sp.]|nr:TRAP transporter substrate-binding protein DctP [Mesorhizobium sp.]
MKTTDGSKRQTITRRAVLASATAIMMIGTVAPALSQEPVVLKTVTPFEPQSPLSKPVQILKEVVERESGGKIQISILGGPEVVPSQQQFDGLRNGVIDIMMAAVPYYAGTVPETFALLYTAQNGAAMRASGLFDFMQDVHRKKGNVEYIANGGGQPGTAFRFYLKKPIEKADFTGLKIRVSQTTADVTTALGGTPVSIPFADTYAALERGVADGFGAPYTGIMDPGLHEVTKYVLQEPFYSLNAPILVNGAKWGALPEDVKAELKRIGPIYETEVEKFNGLSLAAEDTALKEKGMEFITLPPAESAKFQETVQKVGWESYLKTDPEGGPALKELASK